MTDEAQPAAYFLREGERRFRPTQHVGGGWNPEEQHIAPAIGLLAHVIETDRDQRRDDGLRLSRMSCEILGTMPLDVMDIDITVLRPGRTIELIGVRLSHEGRTAVLARAWLTRRYETGHIAGTSLPEITPPESMQPWEPSSIWPGGFVSSIEVRRNEAEPGRAALWIRTDVTLIAGEPVSPVASALGLVDVANGMTPRASAEKVAFPNLDLTVHLFREPRGGGWLGFDVSASFGPDGAGLTHSVVHDEAGPFGTVAQTLTVRPR